MKITKRQLRRIIRESLSVQDDPSTYAPTAAEEAARINQQVPGAAFSTNQAEHERYGIVTGYDLALSIYNSQYSDLYKSVHGIRPRWHGGFTSISEAESELESLNKEAEEFWKAEQEWEAKQREIEDNRALIQSLMPQSREEEDYEKMSKQSGMGRRNEGLVKEQHQMLGEDDELRELSEYIGDLVHYSSEVDSIMKEMGMRYGELAVLTTSSRNIKNLIRELADKFDLKLDDIMRFRQ